MKTKFNLHFIFVLISAVLWGTAGIFVKTANAYGISEMQIVFFRVFLSALILGGVILIKDKSLFKIKLKDLWLFAATGICSIVLFNYSYYKTMALTSLSVAAVLLYTAPFFVFILSVIFFREKIIFQKVLALLIAFFGCCFVTGLFTQNQSITPVALTFGLLTGFGYSLYTIFGQMLINRGYNSFTITFYTFLTAAVGSLPFIDIKQTYLQTVKEPNGILVMLLMAILETVLPYMLYTMGLEKIETSSAPIIATLEPVVATVVSVAVYSEPFKIWHFIGIVLVLTSVIVLNLKVKKNEN